MDLTRVKSSNVDAVGYDDGVLEVHFRNGARYRYAGVEAEEYDALLKADSVGRFLNERIKPNYTYERLEDRDRELDDE